MPRRPNGRNHPRIPSNVVYRSIQAAGGRTALCAALRVSPSTIARWRRAGRVDDARAVLTWAARIHSDPHARWQLACRLAGLRPLREA